MTQLSKELAAYIAAEKTPAARRASDLFHRSARTETDDAILKCTIQECIVEMNKETK